MNLLTLSKEVDLLIKCAVDYEDARDYYDGVNYLAARKALLDQPLTLGMFIPCKDGKPLVKTNRTDFRDWDYQNDMDKLEEAYQEAEKRVLFEGFKLVNPRIIESEHYKMMFFGKRIILDIKVDIDTYYTPIMPENSTISDLAEATQDNPIKLNESNNPN